MKTLRKNFFTLPISIFFLLLYSGVYLSSGYWHKHHNNAEQKSLSYSKSENCDYCKIISNKVFDVFANELSFQNNSVIPYSPFLLENVFSTSVLNQHNKAPPVQA